MEGDPGELRIDGIRIPKNDERVDFVRSGRRCRRPASDEEELVAELRSPDIDFPVDVLAGIHDIPIGVDNTEMTAAVAACGEGERRQVSFRREPVTRAAFPFRGAAVPKR